MPYCLSALRSGDPDPRIPWGESTMLNPIAPRRDDPAHEEPVGISRRTLARTAAWATPVIVLATAAPALAASGLACAPVSMKGVWADPVVSSGALTSNAWEWNGMGSNLTSAFTTYADASTAGGATYYIQTSNIASLLDPNRTYTYSFQLRWNVPYFYAPPATPGASTGYVANAITATVTQGATTTTVAKYSTQTLSGFTTFAPTTAASMSATTSNWLTITTTFTTASTVAATYLRFTYNLQGAGGADDIWVANPSLC